MHAYIYNPIHIYMNDIDFRSTSDDNNTCMHVLACTHNYVRFSFAIEYAVCMHIHK